MTRNPIRLVVLFAVLLAGGAANAEAQPGAGGEVRPQQEQRMERRGRMKAKLIARFDRDGDGRLTGQERRAAKRFVKRMRMQRMHRQHRQGR